MLNLKKKNYDKYIYILIFHLCHYRAINFFPLILIILYVQKIISINYIVSHDVIAILFLFLSR